MTGTFLYLDNTGSGLPKMLSKLQNHKMHKVPQYEADSLDWSGYTGLILTMHSDQHHLMALSDKFNDYLDQGGNVFFNGHVVQPFLPELTPFYPLEKRSKEELVIHREIEHPAFAGIDSDFLTFRKGVAGFYGRGTNPPPPGAVVINSVGFSHAAVDWVSTRASGGSLFVHSGNDLWTFFMVGAPEGLPFVQQFFDWFTETS